MATADFSGVIDSGIDYPNVPSKKHPEGKTYRVESPNAKDGLHLAGTIHLGALAAFGGTLDPRSASQLNLDDDDERDFYARILGCTEDCRKLRKDGSSKKPCGSTHDQMVADEVPWEWFETISQHAYLHFFVGRESAANFLAGRGKATAPEKTVPVPVPNRADKRAAGKAGTKSARASGASGKPTRSRASAGSSSRSRGSAAKTKAAAKPA